MSVVDRFWSKVDARGSDECWLWTGSQAGRGYRAGTGYGQFFTGSRNIRAHRFSAMLHFGMFDRRLLVLHSCDNPPCVNPAHLRLGTALDNSRDMVERGRNAQPSGERHSRARLTDRQVVEIKERYARGHRFRPGNARELAAEYGMAPQYLIAVATGRRRNTTQNRTP